MKTCDKLPLHYINSFWVALEVVSWLFFFCCVTASLPFFRKPCVYLFNPKADSFEDGPRGVGMSLWCDGRIGGAGAFLHNCQVSKGEIMIFRRKVLNSAVWIGFCPGFPGCTAACGLAPTPNVCCFHITGVYFSCNFSLCVSRASSWLEFWSVCLFFLVPTLFLYNSYKMLFVYYFDSYIFF